MSQKQRPHLLKAVAVFILLPWKCSGQDQASFAFMMGDKTVAGPIFRYDAILFNRGGHLNQDTWSMTVPSSGLYMISMTSGAPGDVDIGSHIVRDSHWTATAYRSPQVSYFSTDTLANDVILTLTAGQIVTTLSAHRKQHSTCNGLHMSWGCLAMSGSMGTTVAFAVSVDGTGNYTSGKVPFQHVLTNQGNIWNQQNQHAIIPNTGIYYFFVKTALDNHSQAFFRLRVNGEEIFHLDRTYPTRSYGTMARAVMMNLFAGDIVDIYSTTGGYNWDRRYTLFNGFQYNTSRPERQAWAVYRTSGLSGAYDPFPYDDVRVNDGGSFADNQVVCSFSGIYHIHISAGVPPNSRVQLTLMIGNRVAGELLHTTLQNGLETLGRSLMIECNQGDILRVVSPSWSSVYSSSGLETGFIGFYAFA